MTCRRGFSFIGALIVCFALAMLTVAVSCGGSETGNGSPDDSNAEDETAINPIGDRPEISAWTRRNSEFTYDQFIAVGWKQFQIYDVDTLPKALDARYGFFNRRDVEIRRYPSHEDAMDVGAKSAQEALERVVHDGSGFTSRRVYGGYLVAGNLVMMCEISTDDCVELIEATEVNASQ